MDDTAFDRTLRELAHRALADVEAVVVRRSPTSGQRRPHWGRSLLVAVAAGTLAAGTLAAATVRWHGVGRNGPPARTMTAVQPPIVTPSAVSIATPTPAPSPQPPSAGVPVFYIAHRGDALTEAIDWTGARRGTILAPGNPPGCANVSCTPSPDGSALIVSDSDPGVMRIVDTTGRTLATLARGNVMWADDSRHVCSLQAGQPSSADGLSPEHLMITSLDGKQRDLGLAGYSGGDSGWSVDACSISSDRAVLVHTVCCSATEYTVHRLSTGALIHHQTINGGFTQTSRDGRVMAETGHAPGSAIIDVDTGRRLTTLANMSVLAFDWSGTRAVVRRTTATGHTVGSAFVDWRSGTVLWSRADEVDVAIPRPGSSDMAVASGISSHDGTATDVAIMRARVDAIDLGANLILVV